MIQVKVEGGRLAIEMPEIVIPEWLASVEVDGVERLSSAAKLSVISQNPLRFEWDFEEIGLKWTVDCAPKEERDCSRLIAESSIQNYSDADLSLGTLSVMIAEPEMALGKPGTETVHLASEFGRNTRPVYPIELENCARWSLVKSQFYSHSPEIALQIGFLSFNRLNTKVDHDYDPDAGITSLRALCYFDGWTLAAGETTPIETFTLAYGKNPFAQLEGWADIASIKSNARKSPVTPVGFSGGAWVDGFNVENAEEKVLRNIAAFDRRLPGFGLGYVWVSIANLKDGYPGDWLNWNYESFPSGPQGLVEKLAERGLKLGLWCAPFWMCSTLKEKVAELKDAILESPDGGKLIGRPVWSFGQSGNKPLKDHPFCYALDPSHPKTLKLLKEVFETYREWGIRYYMADFLESGAGKIGRLPYASHSDKTLVAGPEAYHKAASVIREAVGDDTYILCSTGPQFHNAGFADGIRTGNDFGEGRQLSPFAPFYPGTLAMNSPEVWTGALPALVNQASTYYTHRKLYINDSGNLLTVDKPLPLSDAQIHATIHAMSGGPSMLGDDIDRIDDERLAMIKKTLPRSRDVAFPVDLFDSVEPGYPKIFHRKIEKSWGRFDVVSVYNFGGDMLDMTIPLERLGLEVSGEYHIWEFWDSRYVGVVEESLRAIVPPKTVKVFRIVRDTGQPVIIGSDMHVCMGEMEVDECVYDPDKLEIKISAVRPAGEKGNLFVHVPEGFYVENPKGFWIAKDVRYNSLIVRAAMSFDNGRASAAIRIRPIVPIE